MIQWFGRHHRKIQEVGTGIFLYESFVSLYDFIFYPFAIAYWGITFGGAIAVFYTFIINGLVFWFYEYAKVDWLGAHALRELESKENKSNIEKLVTWIGKKKRGWFERLMSPLVFITLLLPIDPVIIAIHYQREHFKGLHWKDWGLLFLATAVANAWWLLKVGLVIEGVLWLWHALF